MFQAAQGSGFEVKTRAVPLAEVEQAWTAGDSNERTVFTI
jgi:hypothetical protein